MANSLLWADLSAEDVALLQEARDVDEARRHLAEIMGFAAEPVPKERVLLEFYLNTLRFAAESKFTVEKTSALFSILKANHEEMVRGYLSIEQSLQYFQQLLLTHAVQRPPYSVGIFNYKDIELVTDYVNTTYYQNFKLFQYCFTQSHVLVLTSRSNPAETAPPAFLPLAEAVPARVVVPAPAADPAEGVAEAPAAAPEASPAAEDLGLDVPEEMKDVILRKIQVEVAKLQREMDAAHQEREARLLKKIAALEAAPPAKGK